MSNIDALVDMGMKLQVVEEESTVPDTKTEEGDYEAMPTHRLKEFSLEILFASRHSIHFILYIRNHGMHQYQYNNHAKPLPELEVNYLQLYIYIEENCVKLQSHKVQKHGKNEEDTLKTNLLNKKDYKT